MTVGYLDFRVSGNPLIKTFSVEQMLPIRNARVWIDLGVIDWIKRPHRRRPVAKRRAADERRRKVQQMVRQSLIGNLLANKMSYVAVVLLTDVLQNFLIGVPRGESDDRPRPCIVIRIFNSGFDAESV